MSPLLLGIICCAIGSALIWAGHWIARGTITLTLIIAARIAARRLCRQIETYYRTGAKL